MWLEGMTLKVSGDAEVLGSLESGNSLTLGSGSRKAVASGLGRGHWQDFSGPPSLCQCLGNSEPDALPSHPLLTSPPRCPSCFLQRF